MSESKNPQLFYPNRLKEKEAYGHFRIEKIRPIEELQADMYELRHDRLGSKVIHIANDDDENFFCISFQTIPKSSNGVAHILEHTVLCGSDAFPVKDPFFSMGRRSLNSYMNALTGSDFTCYPAATQNKKDFYNILEVYLDSVFHPKLRELSFLQEGHRLAFQNETEESPLEIRGIVYNEMKGALSNPMTRLLEAISHGLFPDTPYGKNSGGDPKEIPSLTLTELQEFHKEHYDPSKALFFFYGNLPLEDHLQFLEKQIFSKVPQEPKKPLAPIPSQQNFSKRKDSTILYPAQTSNGEPVRYYSISWKTASIANQLDCLALSILDTVFMGTDASPIKKALLETRLCRQALSSLDLDIQEVPYAIIMSGVQEGAKETLRKTLYTSLEKLASDGISEDAIQRALHQVEFERSEIIGDGTPFGLVLYSRAALLAHHGLDPIWGLSVHSLFDQLRNELQHNPRYLSQIIEKYLLNNPHSVDIEMIPSTSIAATEEEEEKKRLEQILIALSEEEKRTIREKEKILDDYQSIDEDLSLLPKISVQDINPAIPLLHFKEINCQESAHKNLNLYIYEIYTNKITYVDIAMKIPFVEREDLWLIRLMIALLPQIGADDLPYDKFLDEVERSTGGIFSALSLNCHAQAPDTFSPTWHIRGKALDSHIESLFSLFNKILKRPRFEDTKRIRELIEKQYTSLINSLPQQSLKYATLQANAPLSKPLTLQEEWYGLSYFQNLEKLVKNYDTLAPLYLEKIKELASRFLGSQEKKDLIISCEQSMIDKILKNSCFDIGSSQHHTPYTLSWNDSVILQKDIKPGIYPIPIEQKTASIAMSLKAVPYSHEDAPMLSLAGHIMDNIVLHNRIREKGGAYGAGASFQSSHALFQMYSYRDPNIQSTIEAFYDAIDTIIEGDFDDEDIDEAKREIIQGLDSPIAPGSKAEVAYSRLSEGKTDELRQSYRFKLLSADKKSIQESVKRHLKNAREEKRIFIACGKELLEKE